PTSRLSSFPVPFLPAMTLQPLALNRSMTFQPALPASPLNARHAEASCSSSFRSAIILLPAYIVDLVFDPGIGFTARKADGKADDIRPAIRCAFLKLRIHGIQKKKALIRLRRNSQGTESSNFSDGWATSCRGSLRRFRLFLA